MALTARAKRIAEKGRCIADFGWCGKGGHNQYHCSHEVYQFQGKFFCIIDPGWGNITGDAEQLSKRELISLVLHEGQEKDVKNLVELDIATEDEIDAIAAQ